METMSQKNREFSKQLITLMNEKASQFPFKVMQYFWESGLHIFSHQLNTWVVWSLQITIMTKIPKKEANISQEHVKMVKASQTQGQRQLTGVQTWPSSLLVLQVPEAGFWTTPLCPQVRWRSNSLYSLHLSPMKNSHCFQFLFGTKTPHHNCCIVLGARFPSSCYILHVFD